MARYQDRRKKTKKASFESGCDINTQDDRKDGDLNTALHYILIKEGAAPSTREAIFDFLVAQENIDLALPNKFGQTAFSLSLEREDSKLITKLDPYEIVYNGPHKHADLSIREVFNFKCMTYFQVIHMSSSDERVFPEKFENMLEVPYRLERLKEAFKEHARRGGKENLESLHFLLQKDGKPQPK